MLFNTIDFAVFLPIVFLLYCNCKTQKSRNLVIVVASYFFYDWWDWKFLILILFSTVVDYSIGRKYWNPHESKILTGYKFIYKFRTIRLF
jgi:alginate O-acetyltransferase complex protein AlgI